MQRLLMTAALLASLAWVGPATADEGEARLLRFPTINGNQIIFTYAGDLYTVPADGGVARRLTTHEGFEMFPRLSPDGKQVAFTAQYDGNTEVYVMPAEGGKPKRLTFTSTLGRDDISDRMGPNNIVMGWKHDGKHIVFRSRMHSYNDFLGELYTVSVDGGMPEQLPLPRGGFCSFSPDDKKLAFNRVFREFRTWKRYRGGMADDIWVYDFDTKKTENLTPGVNASDVIPMWAGNKIYFLSDRDDAVRMNLWVHNLADKSTKEITKFTNFDVKFPSLGDKAIVFENGGTIFKLDLATDKYEKVPIKILEDLPTARPAVVNVSKNITNFEISPDGKRALFGARGDVFTVPAKNGPTRNLTNTSGVHERASKWSPDGKTIAFISDATGEDEIHIVPQDGGEPAKAVTTGGDTYKYELLWSPDSKKILWADKKLRLQYVDVTSKEVKQVAQGKAWELRDFSWSPDSKWVAYAEQQEYGLEKVAIFSLEQNKNFDVSDGWFAATRPTFSGDGKYLFFVSDRDFSPTYSRTEWNHSYQDLSRIYLVTLAKDTPSPFKPKSDETSTEAAKPAEADAPKADAPKTPEKKEPVVVKVEVEGLKDRILDLPVTPGSYRNLQSAGSTLYYVRQGTKDLKPQLQMFDLTAQKETGLGAVNGFEISADGKKMIVARDGTHSIIDLPKAALTTPEALNVSGLEMKLDRHKEWCQIYEECWRQMRDFFYDPNLHGVDWKGVKEKYKPLLDHVNHRADLTYIIGEMIGELNAGHAYVGGGEMAKPTRVQMGQLGAQLQRDKDGYYKIVKILRGANWDKNLRSPLTEIGVNVKEGDYILAVNGQPTNEMNNIFEALVNTAAKQVTLKVNSEPSTKGARDVVVVPINNEGSLYYYQWVQGNIKKVDEATGGKVGYIHVPDMGPAGLNEFVKHFYPQLTKKALIIDVRGNGGGNVSPMLIERLRREVAMIRVARNTTPGTSPDDMIWGPKVCLMNEFSASDGDLFPWQFKHYKIGPVIGKRSWGGVVGIRGSLPLLDGGYLNRPEFSRYDVAGKEWVIEGYGVDPDIVQDNDPAKEYAGVDEQLNKGVEVIKELLKTQEKTVPPLPPFPKK